MKKLPRRITITPKEGASMLGISVSRSRALFTLIREALGKAKRKPITVKEFCEYEQLSEDEVQEWLDRAE